jgi:hypothetical protein
MKLNWSKHIFVWGAAILFLFAGFANAQTPDRHVSVKPAPDWIETQEYDLTEFSLAQDRDRIYRLIDRQVRIAPQSKDRYYRYVETYNTPGAVEEGSTISTVFDPNYQNVVLHHATIIRDGKYLDKLDLELLQLYRSETDRQKLLYNGDMEAALILPDVRVGDTLDYAFSIRGTNPAFGDNYFERISLQYAPPIQRLHRRTIISDELPVYKKSQAKGDAPNIKKLAGFTEYAWRYENREGRYVDDDQPAWNYTRPGFELTSYKTWTDVGAHFAPYYKVPDNIPDDIQAVVRTIKSDTRDPKKRVKAALEYVQRNVRYFGIEIGAGGYIPRPPGKVHERRFGDCKDVTLLLNTILKELGFEADAVLVNTKELGKFDLAAPNHGAFNHVITRVIVGGTPYFLDATRGVQMGDLDRLDQGHLGQGLLVHNSQAGLIDIAPTDIPWRQDFYDLYDMRTHKDKIIFTNKLTYYGERADSMGSWLEEDGRSEVESQFFEYFQDLYPTIQIKTPLEIDRSEDEGRLTFTTVYEVPKAWEVDTEDEMQSIYVKPYQIQADMPEFVGAERTDPLSVDYPERTRQTLEFLVPEGWSFGTSDVRVNTAPFKFERLESFEDDTYKEIYTYTAKLDHFPVKDFAENMSKISEIRSDLGVTIQRPLNEDDASAGKGFWDSVSDYLTKDK